MTWNAKEGTCAFQGLPVAMLWVDSTLAGLMSGVAAMVGPERFSLALQSEGRKSVEADWLLMSRHPGFSDGFKAIGIVAAVAGWGEWLLIGDDPGKRECRFRAYNTWEGLYQKRLGVCWGSAMLAGKLAGYCTKRFGTNCWATQTAFIANGAPCDEFVVAPSPRSIEDEIERLLSTDLATRADLAVSLTRLHEVQTQLLVDQETLEQNVRARTAELAASRDQLQSVNDRLLIEVDAHKRAEEAIKHGEQLLRVILELAPISMAIVGMDGVIEYINRKAIETFGYQPSDIPTMDQWWLKAYPDPEARNEARERWMGLVTSAIAEGREIQRDDYRITCKDRTVKTIAAFGVPVTDKVFVMFDDITIQALKADLLQQSHAELECRVEARTAELAARNRSLQEEIVERKEVEGRLVQANLALEHTTSQLRKLGAKLARAEEQERKRIAQILHDQLQQLLVGARFNLYALERQVDEALRKNVHMARSAVEEALRESKSLVLELSPPILREGGIDHAMNWIRLRMKETHGLTVHSEVDERANGIEEDLRQAIFHSVRELLLNVVKYSGVSTAEVTIAIRPDARIEVVVADKGCGFAPSTPDRRDGPECGFGLLAIRERFDALGGLMTIESAPKHGCRVTLMAPIASLPSPSGASPGHVGVSARADVAGKLNVLTESPSTARIRILLVDDHRIVRQGLTQLLSQDPGMEVVGEASDGKIGVAQARSLHPDVVLMDIGIPEMDGIEATRVIHAEFPEMIVIGLSMYAESDRGDDMRKAGAAAYVAKSEASEVLVATIHACCGR
jgi:PAS domain S-box-containing protein